MIRDTDIDWARQHIIDRHGGDPDAAKKHIVLGGVYPLGNRLVRHVSCSACQVKTRDPVEYTRSKERKNGKIQ